MSFLDLAKAASALIMSVLISPVWASGSTTNSGRDFQQLCNPKDAVGMERCSIYLLGAVDAMQQAFDAKPDTKYCSTVLYEKTERAVLLDKVAAGVLGLWNSENPEISGFYLKKPAVIAIYHVLSHYCINGGFPAASREAP